MNSVFTLNGTVFTEIDVSERIKSAREAVASYFALTKTKFTGDQSDLDVLDDVIYESPRLGDEDFRVLALLWADLLARQLDLKWYSCSVGGSDSSVIASFDPVAYVIFPEYRIREGLSRGGASLGPIYLAALFEVALASGSTRLAEKARELLGRNVEAVDVLKSLKK